MERTSFVRFRRGVAETLAISPGHLLVFPPSIGITNVALERLIPRGLRAEVRLKDTFDVRVGDVLRQDGFGRIFVVLNIDREVNNTRLFCAELWPPIGDEFDSGRLESFWSASASNVFANDDTFAITTAADTAATIASNAPHLYQEVEGDFDVYARLRCNVGDAMQVNQIGIIARTTTAAYAAVGLYANASMSFQHGQHNGTSGRTTLAGTWPGSTWAHVRLVRFGSRFAGLCSMSVNPPLRESDWIEIEVESQYRWRTVEKVRVGLFAFYDGTLSTPANAAFDFFRNWQASGR